MGSLLANLSDMRWTRRGSSDEDTAVVSSNDLAPAFGADAAVEHPLLHPLRAWRTQRTGIALVGAVSGVSVLVLAFLGVVPTLPGLAVVAAFGLGLLPALPLRRQVEAGGAAPLQWLRRTGSRG
jgi:hypothetical protein